MSAVDADGNPISLQVTYQRAATIGQFSLDQGIVTVGASSLPIAFIDNGDGTGVIRVRGDAFDRGNYVITIRASDDGDAARSPIGYDDESFVVSITAPSVPPRFLPLNDRVGVVGETMSFIVQALDLDQDPLALVADGLPDGATFTPLGQYGRARLTWTPAAGDVGDHVITFRATDDGAGGAGPIGTGTLTLTIAVRTSNTAPQLTLPAITIAEGGTIDSRLDAVDPDGDPLTFSAEGLPAGASLDPLTGRLLWTPNLFQQGQYQFDVTVTDGNRSATGRQLITVENTNRAPVLAGLYPLVGFEGQRVEFQLSAGDPDLDPVIFSAVSALPRGAVFDPATGKLFWTPDFDQDGEYRLRFEARDPSGASDETDVVLRIANVNRVPVIAVTNRAAVLGQTFDFVIAARDPDLGAVLDYSARGLPEGASLDPRTGRLTWSPTLASLGDHLVLVSVSDGEATVVEPMVLRVLAQSTGPAVTIDATPSFPVLPGQLVQVQVQAEGFAPVVSRRIFVDGVEQRLDADNRIRITAGASGRIVLRAEATDADGFVGIATSEIKIRNALDTTPPDIALAEEVDETPVRSVRAIAGSVSDQALDTWTLALARLGTTDYATIAEGRSSMSGVLGTLDPGQFANGFYTLRLTASDVEGRSRVLTRTIEINSADKPTRLLRDETDATVTLGGQTLSIVRQYDSFAAGETQTFGRGWRLAMRDLDVQAGVAKDLPFEVGSRLYLTLPDGRRVGFTFTSTSERVAGLVYHLPGFVADDGVEWRLEAAPTRLILANGRYYDLTTAQAYNPTRGDDEPLVLVGPDGTRMHINATAGVRQIDYPGGASLILSDSGIVATNGDRISFVADPAGVGTMILPGGDQILYRYDSAGRLAQVRNLVTATSKSFGYEPGDADRLILATEGQGISIAYGAGVSSQTLAGDLGSGRDLLTLEHSGVLSPGRTDVFALTFRTSDLSATPTGKLLVIAEVESLDAFRPDAPVSRRRTDAVQRLAWNLGLRHRRGGPRRPDGPAARRGGWRVGPLSLQRAGPRRREPRRQGGWRRRRAPVRRRGRDGRDRGLQPDRRYRPRWHDRQHRPTAAGAQSRLCRQWRARDRRSPLPHA